MSENNWVDYNGKLFPANEPIFTSQNRAFRYGDGLFESIRVVNNKIPLLALHYQRLLRGADQLKISLPANFTEEYCQKQILHLAKKNDLSKNGRIRLSVFRGEGGLYVPKNNAAQYLIEGIDLEHDKFNLNIKGLTVDIYADIENHPNALTTYKTNNALPYVMAAIYKKEQDLDDCLLVNSRSRVIESINSNLFLVKDNQILTPPLVEGCVAGVMREFILYLAEKEKITVQETPVTLEELFGADEAFLTNAIYGIRWIEKYKSKIYTNHMSVKLSELLNKALIEN